MGLYIEMEWATRPAQVLSMCSSPSDPRSGKVSKDRLGRVELQDGVDKVAIGVCE